MFRLQTMFTPPGLKLQKTTLLGLSLFLFNKSACGRAFNQIEHVDNSTNLTSQALQSLDDHKSTANDNRVLRLCSDGGFEPDEEGW